MPEALALGVPVLALDHHSMSAVIDESVGHKVPMSDGVTSEQIVDRVAEKLRYWDAHRDELFGLSAACLERSAQLSPEHRVATFRRIHAELLAEGVPENPPKTRAVSDASRSV